MSRAGWYPDPGGAPGMFRWWDGSSWTATLTATPYGPPPPSVLPPPTQAGAPAGAAYGYGAAGTTGRRGRGPLIVVALVGGLVLALVAGAVLLFAGRLPNPFSPGQPASNPTEDFCPTKLPSATPEVPRVDQAGRVQGGKLSFPLLGAPWGPPFVEDRVPFGRDATEQTVIIEEQYDGLHSWVASVLVAELVAGDGFFSPEQGADIVATCVLGEFYDDAVVQREDRVNEAATVDGKDAWLIEMHLSFDIPNLQEKGETAIILVVRTGEEASSLYYASIPDSRPDLLAEARQVQEQLRVEP